MTDETPEPTPYESEKGGALAGRAGAAAYYGWPLVWTGKAPDNVHVSVPRGELPPNVNLEQLADIVIEVSLPGNLRARAHRDGLIAFDFSSWAPRLDLASDQAGLTELQRLSGLSS